MTGDEVTETVVVVDMGTGEWGLYVDWRLPGPLHVLSPGQLHHRVQAGSGARV